MGCIPWDIVCVVYFVMSDLMDTIEMRHLEVGGSGNGEGALVGALRDGWSCLDLTIFYEHGGYLSMIMGNTWMR